MRVVSLSPAATEILAHIGGAHLLVARSHACDTPPEISELPVATRPPDPRTPGASLNDQLLLDLAPDLILTHAPGPGDPALPHALDHAQARLARRNGTPPTIIALAPDTIEGVLDDHLIIGRAVDLERQAGDAIFELRGRLLAAESFVNPYTEGPIVGFLESTEPLTAAGLWVAQMIERAGGRHPLNPTTPRTGAGAAAGMQAGLRSAGRPVRIPPELFLAVRPDVLIVAPRDRSLDEAYANACNLRDKAPWWADLPAARAHRVAVVDGRHAFTRPGPRLIDAFEWLVGWLNDRPELIPPGFPWRALA
jgi:ABC-type Fe3+-hydroxamate transport system substrate-binding protein